MFKSLRRFTTAMLFSLAALHAHALLVLPFECQFDSFNEACVPGEGPNTSEQGALIGAAILQKLVDAQPEYAVDLLASDFIEQWTAAWVTFPVPQVIEEQIALLDPDDFNAWLEWLCNGLHPNAPLQPVIDFQQVPVLVVSSFTPANASVVPLPASIWLFASAVLGLTMGRKRRQ
ncbi:MAG: VPLPA-CTERM sorting domain-containing protein [Pseudomonadales bacterium]